MMTATRRVRDGEDSDEDWDDLSDEELKKDPSWMPAGRSDASWRSFYLLPAQIYKSCNRALFIQVSVTAF